MSSRGECSDTFVGTFAFLSYNLPLILAVLMPFASGLLNVSAWAFA